MRRAALLFTFGLTALGLWAAGCDDGAADSTSTSSSSSSSSTGSGEMVQCTTPTAVPCSDEVILQMSLKKTVTDAMVGNTPDGAGFRSTIDATGGGLTPTKSYTYARFTEAGLEKVDISDEDSLDSMDWDIAFRRYIIRINSGHSGPSCVTASRIPDKYGAYDDLTSVPGDLTYHPDDYFTPPDSCMLIPDGSGLPASPATALSTYWTYPGCVAMSDFVYAIQLASGKHVKFQVQHYYSPDVQEQCDTTHKIPASNTGSGSFEVRWAFVP
ncbi:MAG: HmuY family protein [Polyangiaceae bacterium]